MCFLCCHVLTELTASKEQKRHQLCKIVLQSFYLLMSGERCESPGAAMTCFNSMLTKGAYKARLGMVKSDLHEESVRGLCSMGHNAEAPLMCCPGWLSDSSCSMSLLGWHKQLAHFPRHSICFAICTNTFSKINTVVLQCFKCYTAETKMMNKWKITHRWSCKTLWE